MLRIISLLHTVRAAWPGSTLSAGACHRVWDTRVVPYLFGYEMGFSLHRMIANIYCIYLAIRQGFLLSRMIQIFGIVLEEKTVLKSKKYCKSVLNLNQSIWYSVLPHTFVSPYADSRRAVVRYWQKYVHKVLVNRLGGLSLPRKSVIRLNDRPDMTLNVYHEHKTIIQQHNS